MFYNPPPFIPPPGSHPLSMAYWSQRYSRPNVDQTWLIRNAEQEVLNRRRAKSWATRFKALGVEHSGE